MTRRRYDEHSTEFGLWLRQQTEIDSSLGYVTTNIDFVWKNHKTGNWLFLEEKRHGKGVSWCQQQIFGMLDRRHKNDKDYHGFHLLVFENTNPEDGRMYLDYKEITKDYLLRFLQFEILLPSIKW